MSRSSATERFYRDIWPHRAGVLRSALILCGNAADAEDLAQETLLKAFRSLHQLRDGSSPGAWLLTILRHTRIDKLRSAGRLPPTADVDELEIAAPPAAPVADDRRPQEILETFSDQQLIAALQALPEEIRWSILLVEVQGRALSEAAALLGVPEGTIKSRLHRGRAMLRAKLTGEP